MNRLELVRQVVDRILLQQDDLEERRCGFVHLYGVSATCVALALRRGMDSELCAVAGMLHDIATYQTADPTDHARRSASEAQRILVDLACFTQSEIDTICLAISCHSDKLGSDEPVSELLKDADVLQHFLYNPSLLREHPYWTDANQSHPVVVRVERVLAELSLNDRHGED